MFRYYREKLHANHFWELKGFKELQGSLLFYKIDLKDYNHFARYNNNFL